MYTLLGYHHKYMQANKRRNNPFTDTYYTLSRKPNLIFMTLEVQIARVQLVELLKCTLFFFFSSLT